MQLLVGADRAVEELDLHVALVELAEGHHRLDLLRRPQVDQRRLGLDRDDPDGRPGPAQRLLPGREGLGPLTAGRAQRIGPGGGGLVHLLHVVAHHP